MKLSTKARYAVMAMVEMAKLRRQDATSLTFISDSQSLSLTFLEQIFLKLRRAGLVKSVRGSQGGYLLTREPDDISIYDVIVSVNEPIKTVRCAGHDKPLGCQPDGARCLTHDLWNQLDNVVKFYLKSVTLSDVCSKKIGDISFEGFCSMSSVLSVVDQSQKVQNDVF